MTLQFIPAPGLGIVEVVNVDNDATILIDEQEARKIRKLQLDPVQEKDIVRYLKVTGWIHPDERVNIERKSA